jgi:hypothetical protein
VLVDRGFEQLRALIPKPPARAALGLRPKDKYWLHMFDALALSMAAQPPISRGPESEELA